MPGRPSKPTAVKKAQGTYERCKTHVTKEMMPAKVDGIPGPPSVLNKNAMKLWQDSVLELAALQMLHTVDLAMLAAYCMKMDLFFRMTAFCEKHGYVNEKGRRRGESIEARDALDQANKIAQQFGFVPAARTKISMPEKANEDEYFD